MSIAITSSNFIFCLVFLGAPQGSILYSLFLISYSIHCYETVSSWWYIAFHCYVQTSADKLNPDLKANLNGHPSICHSIKIWIRLKKLCCHGNHKIISLTNLFKYLLSAEMLSEWKTEFIFPYLVRNVQINA